MIALQTELNELIETMKVYCAELGISVPSVMTSRRRGGCYYVSKQTINLGQINLKDPAMLKQVFVHELAHHVDHQVNAQVWEDRKWRRIARSSRSSHDRTFYKLLLGVIDTYYGDRTAYPWKWEYKTIGNWARWAGYSTEKKESKVKLTKRTDLSDFFPMPVRYAAEQVNS
jgi:hypothetical protein